MEEVNYRATMEGRKLDLAAVGQIRMSRFVVEEDEGGDRLKRSVAMFREPLNNSVAEGVPEVISIPCCLSALLWDSSDVLSNLCRLPVGIWKLPSTCLPGARRRTVLCRWRDSRPPWCAASRSARSTSPPAATASRSRPMSTASRLCCSVAAAPARPSRCPSHMPSLSLSLPAARALCRQIFKDQRQYGDMHGSFVWEVKIRPDGRTFDKLGHSKCLPT